MNLNQVTLPSVDIERSIAFYQGMGFRLIVNASPNYARFECPIGEATFSVEFVEATTTGPRTVIYFECDDVDHQVEQLRQAGYHFDQLPQDESWLWREARLRDPSSNVICLYTAGQNRRFPPWRVPE
ncbi:MAG: VOC family protein [Pirellulaceae bacterium]|nr:VOC family protein [Pirellulaceae bacterium]